MDILFFETILFTTLLFNTIVYAYSMYKIKMKSPDSVVQREMKKTSGYLLVQLIVWLPAFISNVYSISEKSPTKLVVRTSTSLQKGFKIQIALNDLQGFLNCIVYIYTDRMFRKWMRSVIGSMKRQFYRFLNGKKELDNRNTDRTMSTTSDLELVTTPRTTIMEDEDEKKVDKIIENNTKNYQNNPRVKSILTVKSVLHKSKKDKNINFEVKKFVKFKADPEIRFFGGEPNRLTDSTSVAIRIGNELSLDEKNS